MLLEATGTASHTEVPAWNSSDLPAIVTTWAGGGRFILCYLFIFGRIILFSVTILIVRTVSLCMLFGSQV